MLIVEAFAGPTSSIPRKKVKTAKTVENKITPKIGIKAVFSKLKFIGSDTTDKTSTPNVENKVTNALVIKGGVFFNILFPSKI